MHKQSFIYMYTSKDIRVVTLHFFFYKTRFWCKEMAEKKQSIKKNISAFFYISGFKRHRLTNLNAFGTNIIWLFLGDRAERHDFWSQFLLFILCFFFPLFLGGKGKGKRITKVVVKSHAFLLDLVEAVKKILKWFSLPLSSWLFTCFLKLLNEAAL